MILKAYSTVRDSAVASILLLIVIISGCASPRYLNDDQALVTKIKLEGIDKQYQEIIYQYIQKDIRPNSKFNLTLYNIFNTKNGKYRIDRIKNIGQAPNILDSALVDVSRLQMEKYLKTKGFFKAEVKSDIAVKHKKATLTFTAERGPLFTIRNINYVIPDTALKALYFKNKASFSRLDTGKRYDADTLAFEREQVFQLLKRNGYYDYQRQYMYYRVDSNLFQSKADIKLFIDNPVNKNNHLVYTIDSSFITIKKNDNLAGGIPDTAVIDSQYVFRDYSKRFRARAISSYVFLKKGKEYSVEKEDLTYDRLYELNVFKNIKIEYVKAPDSSRHILYPQIEAIPLKKMSNRVEGEGTFNSGRYGFNIGDTYTNRNLFRGAEQLEVKFKYGILFDSQAGRSGVFNRDLQLGANLTFPRLLVPFNLPLISTNGLPHTIISSSVQVFNQIDAFQNRIYINSITYDWVESKYKLHSLTPINVEYRDGRLDPVFKEDLLSKGYNLYVATNDRRYFNLGTQYSFTFNGIRLATYNNFFYFKGIADIGGNSLGLLSKALGLKRDPNGDRTMLGLPYLQYAKAEIDLRYYKSFGGERQLILRADQGVGNPYGNTRVLPFEKNFYAGGSSGVRAWQARALGPGNYNRSILSDTLRKNLRNLDQLGEIKFEGNIEYRFKIANSFVGAKLKGATFTDFGNVWRIRESVANPGGEFKFDKFIGQMAIGAGAGLRFDLDYFVFRLDAGVKIKDPQFTGSDQWVIKHIFDSKTFKDAYSQSNGPDVYRFIQYNFGIGMPF